MEHVAAPATRAAGARRASRDDTSTAAARDDGWLAVFFEFWAHVIRHPELRERFAEIHRRRRCRSPARSSARRASAASRCPMALRLAVASGAMQIGLALERLTQPEVVDKALGDAHGPRCCWTRSRGERR